MASRSVPGPAPGSGVQKPVKPLSPWAARYGLPEEHDAYDDVVFHRGPLRHSTFAPQHPGLDPLYHADKPLQLGTGVFRTEDEVDKLFVSQMFSTIKSKAFSEWWQLGVSKMGLRFSDRGIIPGGHQRASASAFKNDPSTHPGWLSRLLYEGELIVPREETWFPFLAKNRWYNWIDNGALPNHQIWSVDHPLVWEVLSISLELANRVLRTLIADQHPFFQTLVFGYFGPWARVVNLLSPGSIIPPVPFPTATLLISYQQFQDYRLGADQMMVQYMESVASLTAQHYVQRINKLLENQVWTFGQWNVEFGRTLTGPKNVIALDCGIIRTLIEGKITLAERCTLQFYLAHLMLHELAHSILGNRAVDVFGQGWSEPEPFIDFAGASEIGNSFEVALWGGRLQLGTRPGRATFPPLGLYTETWPYPHQLGSEGERAGYIHRHADFAAGKTIELSIMTSDFVSKMLSEAFWNDDTIPRKSDNHFNRVPLFVSRTPHIPYAPLFRYIKRMGIDKRRSLDRMSMLEKFMVQEWKEKEAREWNMELPCH